jgi:DNA modification methylase
MTDIHLLQGDCLNILPTLADKSVDAIITDLPYGTTACSWDVIIPLEPMWEQVKRLCKGAFVTTASQPFTSVLIMSNLAWFKYDWVWNKKMVSNFGNAKIQPLRCHESVLIFSKNGHTYNPQKTGKAGKPYGKLSASNSDVYSGGFGQQRNVGVGYPKTIVEFPRPNNLSGGGLHPTQKPVALYEYLIKTYTNPGDTVLDFCMGSGTTGCAAVKTGRNFIGIEREPKYFAIAERRITEAQMQMVMPL